jgi:type II secretory pathway component PulF
MNYDEISFLNQQLAEMLRTGIPLEAGLKQVCAGMKSGTWKSELASLAQDLSRGTSLSEALKHRNLPKFYTQMLTVGAQGNDLTGMLTLLADHYHRRHQVWTRLQGLMVYPIIVLCCALALSLGFTVALGYLARSAAGEFWTQVPVQQIQLYLLLPTALIAAALGAVVLALFLRPWQQFLLWRLPAFREAALADFASTMALMLKKGVPLPQALAMYREIDAQNPLSSELSVWQTKMAGGAGKAPQFAEPGRCIPPLFVWLLAGSGEALTSGFERAADIFYARARHLTELLLYAALPVMILFLGTLIVIQVVPVASILVNLLNSIGGIAGD